jgi:hypothetical protein
MPLFAMAPVDIACESAKYLVSWQFTQATFLTSPTAPDCPATVMPSATFLVEEQHLAELGDVVVLVPRLNSFRGRSPASGSSFLIRNHSWSVNSSFGLQPATTEPSAMVVTMILKRMFCLLSCNRGRVIQNARTMELVAMSVFELGDAAVFPVVEVFELHHVWGLMTTRKPPVRRICFVT